MTSTPASNPRRRRRGKRPGGHQAGGRQAGGLTAGGPQAGGDPAIADPAAGDLASDPAAGTRQRPADKPDDVIGGPDAGVTPTAGKSRNRQRPGDHDTGRETDRHWRDLTANSPSQVGVGGALRARDVARPGPSEMAAAERDVVLVRRQWQPTEELNQRPR